MKLLKNIHDIENLMDAVNRCRGDVILRSADGREEYDLKNELARYIAIGELCKDEADDYELFCMNPSDEGHMLNFFYKLDPRHAQAA